MVCCNISNDQMTRFYFVIWSKLCPAAQRVSRIGQLTSVLSLIYLFFIKFIIVTRGYWLKFSFWCSYTDQQGTSWCCSWQEGSNEKIAQVHIWWRKSFGGEPLFWHFVNISWLDKGLEQGLLPFFSPNFGFILAHKNFLMVIIPIYSTLALLNFCWLNFPEMDELAEP